MIPTGHQALLGQDETGPGEETGGDGQYQSNVFVFHMISGIGVYSEWSEWLKRWE